MGIFFVWNMFNEPVNGILLWPSRNIPGGVGATRYFSNLGNIYYAKILWLEMWNSMIMIYCYLLIIYKPSLRTVDELIKGLGFVLVLYACWANTAESGGSLNPALGLA